MKNRITLNPQQSLWLADTIARNRARFGHDAFRMEGEGGDGGSGDGGDGAGDGGKGDGEEGAGQTFKQADVDRIVADRLKREREATKAKYADYDDIKKAAEGKKSADDRIAELEGKHAAAEARALRADIANRHGISTEDRDLFLTATDEESLTAQAKRLSERDGERKQRGNRSPREGHTSTPKADQERDTVRTLFGGGD